MFDLHVCYKDLMLQENNIFHWNIPDVNIYTQNLCLQRPWQWPLHCAQGGTSRPLFNLLGNSISMGFCVFRVIVSSCRAL